MNTTTDNSHKTAIKRRGLSAPAKWLHSQRLISGQALDYGCGHGQDADELFMHKYDPHYCPSDLDQGVYDTVLCTYVLNVLDTREKVYEVLNRVRSLLRENGFAYFSVRNDKRYLKGQTKLGTYQCLIDIWSCERIHKTSSYSIYKMGYYDYIGFTASYFDKEGIRHAVPTLDPTKPTGWREGYLRDKSASMNS